MIPAQLQTVFSMMTMMLQSGADISPVITHRFAYSDFQKGFAAMESGQAATKVILDWTSLG